jgi:pyrimidine operon attenuation protein/uracil phosphoribosyltransferase
MRKLPPATDLLQKLVEAMRASVTPDTVLVGIHTGGVWIAEYLREILGIKAPLGSIDVSYHRDDHHLGGGKHGGRASQLPLAVEGAHVVIVDDVLATGRTIRAAINELFDYGRPAKVDLAVLVDRGARELPIAATWSGGKFVLPVSQMLALSKDDNGTIVFRIIEK